MESCRNGQVRAGLAVLLTVAALPLIAWAQVPPATQGTLSDAEWRRQMEARMQQLEQENRELREHTREVADNQQALMKDAQSRGLLTVEGGQPRLTTPDFFDINKYASEGNFPGSILIPRTNTSMQIGGYVQLDALFDSDRINNKDGFVVSSIETGGAKTGAGDTNFSIRQTRLFWKTETPTQNWGNLVTYIETDFFGTDGPEIRLRHAYGQVGDKFQFLAGQTWSAFQDATVFPNSLDAQGPPGIITSRRPQVRIRDEFSKEWYGTVALEDPVSELTTPVGLAGEQSTPYPDLAGNIRWVPEWGHIQLGGVVRYLQFDPDVGSRESEWGYGLNLTGSVKTIKLDDKHIDSVLYQIAAGNGIARYINDTGGLGLDAVLAAPGADLDGLTAYAGMVAYQHWWATKWGSTIGYSIVSIDNDAAEPGSDYHQGQYGFLNIRYYPAERVMLGAEILYGIREDKDGSEGDDVRLQFSAQYRFQRRDGIDGVLIMSAIAELLRHHPEIALFATLSLGYFLGQFKIGPVALGTVASTLLVGVVIGLANIKIDPFTKSVFFYLFIFAIGYKVGPQFFSGLRGEGLQQAALAVIFCLIALAAIWSISMVLGYDKGLAAGLLAGAVTESASIGSAGDAINRLNVPNDVKAVAMSHVAVGYSVTYLFGSAGVTWFLSQMAPKVLRTDLRADCKQKEKELSGGKEDLGAGVNAEFAQFVARAYRADGKGGAARTVADIERDGEGRFSVERVRKGNAIIEAEASTLIAPGDVLAIVGRRESVMRAESSIGEEIADMELLHFPLQTADIVLTKKELIGRTLGELARRGRGVRLKKLVRLGQEVSLLPETTVSGGDTLQVIGAPRNVERIAKDAGYIERPTPDADLTWLAAGIVLGVLIGIPALMIKGVAIGLGTSGGVLVMGLILGYLRASYPVFGKLPAAAGWLLETMGLNTFIAIVGLGAGLSFVSGLKTFGVPLLISGILAVLIPHTLTLLIGRRFFPSMNRGVLVGVCCGSGTNTPALLAVQEAAQSKVPVLGYAVPYAIGNVLLIAWGPVLVNLIPKLPAV